MKVCGFGANRAAGRLFKRNGIEGLVAFEQNVENSDIFGLEVFARGSSRGTLSK